MFVALFSRRHFVALCLSTWIQSPALGMSRMNFDDKKSNNREYPSREPHAVHCIERRIPCPVMLQSSSSSSRNKVCFSLRQELYNLLNLLLKAPNQYCV